jgi:apolipoprotein N-acyltransferase
METMPMMDGGTPYRVLADWPAYLCVLAVPAIYINRRFRRKKK